MEKKTEQELKQDLKNYSELLNSSGNIREKVLWSDNFLKEYIYYYINSVYATSKSLYTYSRIENHYLNILNVYFQNLDVDLIDVGSTIKLKKEIKKYEVFFEYSIYTHIGEYFFEVERNGFENDRDFVKSILLQILNNVLIDEWESKESHILFSFYVNVKRLEGLYKRLDKYLEQKQKKPPAPNKNKLAKIKKIQTDFKFYQKDNSKMNEMDLKTSFSDKYKISVKTLYRYLKVN